VRVVTWFGAVCAAVALLFGMAGAAPSHLGPTGVVATPTADVVGARQYDVAVDYIKWDEFGEDVKSWPIRLLVGVSDKVEAGVGYTSWKNSAPTMKIIPFHGKVMIVPESEKAPAVAIGAGYGRFKDPQFLNPAFTDDLKVTTVYAVATKTLTKAPEEGVVERGIKGMVRGSLGLMYNKYGNSVSDSATKPFASLEYIAPNGNTTLAVEYKLKEKIPGLKDKALSSVVVRHMFSANVWAQIGLTNVWYTVANPDCGNHELLIGVGYRWMPEPEEEWYY